MSSINLEYQNDLATITLNNGASNAISPEMVEEISTALQEIEQQAKGLLLKGGEKFFSMGFDLPTLINFERPKMTGFLQAFDEMIAKLYCLPQPTVCILEGHAIAGGNIIAIACDLRLAGNPERKTGLNEIQLGVPVPYLPDQILKQLIGERAAMKMLYSGDFISFSEALDLGLIDELVETDKLAAYATTRLTELAKRPAAAWAAIKEQHTGEILRRWREYGRKQTEIFLDCWFQTESRSKLEAAAARF